MSLSTKYSPTEIEDKWYARWIEAKAFKSTPDSRTPYTITIPPPNVTGVLHMGHMLNNTIQDVLIRRKRMQGFNACWVPGTDHASIATEAKVVRWIREEMNLSKSQIGREKFLEYAMQWKDKYGGIILQQLRKLGASCDWDRTTFTMDEHYYKAVVDIFVELYDKGYIYRGNRMVNWDSAAQTAVSDEEVLMETRTDKLYYVQYQIEGTEEFLTVATTRPETIMADTAVAINPTDERYTHLHGKRVIVPLVKRSVPIILDEYVETDFGTGCLKVTPANDKNDYEIGIRHNLEIIEILNPDGTLNEAAQFFVGETVAKARKLAAKELEAQGNLAKMEDYTHSVGVSERTGVVIEPRLSQQWFLNMQNISKPALNAVLEGEVKIIPDRFVNTYRHWMENVKDWCLSRQLWWGQRIPAYFIKGSAENAEDEQFVVAKNIEEAVSRAQTLTGNAALTAADLRQDDDVLDTWASSWIWPIEVFKGYSSPDNADFNYYYPTNDLVTAPEILFFWVARMVMAGYEFYDKKPFTNVYLTGIVRDKLGRKMSKQLGNSPDPLDLIALYGADGVRMGLMMCAAAGNDIPFDESSCEQGRNFANKIWNAFRLVKGWETVAQDQTELERKTLAWISSKIAAVRLELNDHFEKYRINDAALSIYRLIWDDFCAWFLELMKPPYGQPISEISYERVLDVFGELLEILHPFMPFISEELWQNLRERHENELLCLTQYGEIGAVNDAWLTEMEVVREFVQAVRAFRAEKQLSPKESIELYIKTENKTVFEKYSDLLQKFLNTSKIEFVQEKVEGAGSLRAGANEAYIPLLNVDVEAEKAKIHKEIEYTEGFLKSVINKLSNEKFVNGAPAQVIESERKKQADAEAKLELLRESLASLG